MNMHKFKTFVFFLICLSNFEAMALTRCEESFEKNGLGTAIANCREELQGPIDAASKVAVLETLGKAYLAQGEPEIAIAAWTEASQYLSLDKTNVQNTEDWARLQVLIGQTYSQTNQAARAESQFKKTLKQVKQLGGSHSISVGLVEDALGSHYALQKNEIEAEKSFQKSRIVYEIRLGKLHPKTIETRLNRAIGMLDMGKDQEARALFENLASLVNQEKAYLASPIRAEVLTFLGTMQMRLNQLDQATVNYQTAFEVRKAAFGPSDVRTSQSLNNLGVVLYRAGDLKKSEAVLGQAYVIRKEKLGEQNPLTLSTQKNLQAVLAAQNAKATKTANQ